MTYSLFHPEALYLGYVRSGNDSPQLCSYLITPESPQSPSVTAARSCLSRGTMTGVINQGLLVSSKLLILQKRKLKHKDCR